MIRILTDSTCDLLPKYLEKFDIEVLPLSVTFGDETFRDGIDLTYEEFYARLAKADKLPTTAQIPPAVFEDAFRRHVEAGDEVLAILISSGISGTYQSACIAKEAIGSDRVHIVDSRQATLSLGLLVHFACLLRDSGKTVEEIERILNEVKKYARLWVIIDTLKYLKMGRPCFSRRVSGRRNHGHQTAGYDGRRRRCRCGQGTRQGGCHQMGA